MDLIDWDRQRGEREREKCGERRRACDKKEHRLIKTTYYLLLHMNEWLSYTIKCCSGFFSPSFLSSPSSWCQSSGTFYCVFFIFFFFFFCHKIILLIETDWNRNFRMCYWLICSDVSQHSFDSVSYIVSITFTVTWNCITISGTFHCLFRFDMCLIIVVLRSENRWDALCVEHHFSVDILHRMLFLNNFENAFRSIDVKHLNEQWSSVKIIRMSKMWQFSVTEWDKLSFSLRAQQ